MFWYEQSSNFPCLVRDTTGCYVVCNHLNKEGQLCDDEGKELYTSDPTRATFIAPISTILNSLNITHPELFL